MNAAELRVRNELSALIRFAEVKVGARRSVITQLIVSRAVYVPKKGHMHLFVWVVMSNEKTGLIFLTNQMSFFVQK